MPNIIVQNDLLPVLEGHIQNADASPVNLTGTTVIVRIQRPQGSVVSASVSVIDAPNGIVQYAWQPGDTNMAGMLNVVFVVTRSGLPQTYPTAGPISIQVLAGI